MAPHPSIEDIQQQTLRTLGSLLAPGQTVALLDFPTHENAGDHLIYLGTRRYLDRLGVDVAYVADIARYNPEVLRRRVAHGPILLMGGGSLGDQWPGAQEFRYRVLKDFGARPIIQLPQSLHFASSDSAEQAQRAFAGAESLTLMLREEASLARAEAQLPGVATLRCPDLAFGLAPLNIVLKSPRLDILAILRRDREKGTSGIEPEMMREYGSRLLITDWGFTGHRRALWATVRLPGFLAQRSPRLGAHAYRGLALAYEAMARMNLTQSVRLLSQAKVVIADRLHAVILAALMGIPAIALDNSYGKLSAMHHATLRHLPNVWMAEDPQHAQALARAALQAATC